jgi:serine/threonine-protein kinase
MLRPIRDAASSEEESRDHLQSRLATLWKVMFWAFAALIVSQLLLYEVFYREMKPIHQNAIYLIATIGLTLMAFIWRGVLVRRKLPVDQLYAIDTFYAVASGSVLAVAAICAWNLTPSHYVCLIYGVFAVFTRTIVVPSSGKRTLVVSTIHFVPMIAAALWLALEHNVEAIEGPASVFFFGAVSLAAVAVVLAAVGSDRIYGLRKQVTEVMQLGQYKRGRKLGEGGMGAVYEAKHILLRRPTAIKLMHSVTPEAMTRFEAEVQAMSELTHPNTAVVFDYGHSDGVFYYAMEYLGDGINLAKLIAKHGPQPAGRVVAILEQVCGALAEAHGRNLIHRDIKPANIILCERGLVPDVAKVVDFGLVKDIAPDATGQSAQIIVGTPHYLSPEQLLGRPITVAVDLYALGLVGYELLTGKRPFDGKTVMDYATKHITAIPKKPSEISAIHISAELEAIIMKCLEKDPEKRYAGALELAEALHGLPAAKDWTADDARTWWRDHKARAAAETEVTEQPTQTITVDLGNRA